MIARLLKGFAYVKAPIKTFAALHPLRFAKYAALFWVGKKVWNRFTDGDRRAAGVSGGTAGAPAVPSGGEAA